MAAEQPLKPKVKIFVRTPKRMGARKIQLKNRVLDIANLSGHRVTDFRQTKPRVVNKRNFNAFAREVGPETNFNVADRIGNDPKLRHQVTVRFTKPPHKAVDEIVAQVPCLNQENTRIKGMSLLQDRLAVDARGDVLKALVTLLRQARAPQA